MRGLFKRACIACVLCVATAVVTHAQTFATLQSFDGTDGQSPSTLIEGTDGNFYGTTESGGANATCGPYANSECGTIFEVTPAGVLTTLHSFNGTDGYFPQVLIEGAGGKFYGMTFNGGSGSVGTLFSIIPGGTLITLYNFCSQTNCADGSYPSGLVQGSDGNFYGTTAAGGANGSGTLFEITPAGVLTTL